MANLEQTPSTEGTESDQLPRDNPYQNYSWMQLHDALSEKEYLLECAQDIIKRLSVFEAENIRKDDVITSLRKDLAAFKKNSRKKDFSYVSMEEHLASCEGHLHERMDEVKTLQQELEDVRKQLEASSARSLVIQKELLTKKSTNGRHMEEIAKLQRQHRSDSESILSLKKEVAEKQSTTMSLQERVKRLRCTNQELQKGLEDAQAQKEAMSLNEQKLKVELAKIKNHASIGKLLEARQDFCEQELTKAKRKENDLACDVGRLREELTSMCKTIAALTNTASSTESTTPSMALHVVSNIVKEHSQAKESTNTLTQQLEELQNDHHTMCERVEDLQQLWTDFKNAVDEDSLPALDTLISGLHETDSSEIFKDLKDAMLESLSNLSSYVNKQSCSLSKLSEMVVTSYRSLPNHEKEVEDPTIMMSFLREKVQSTLSECEQLNQRLCESELEHGAALSGAVAALRQDEETRMSKLLEKTREEEMEKWSTKLQDLQQKLELEKKEAVQQEQANTVTLSEELKQLKETIDCQQTEHEISNAKLMDVEAELASLEASKNKALCEADAQKSATVHKLTVEIDAYKTKAHQYALTIAALEEKLLEMMYKVKTLQGDKGRFSQSLEKSSSTSDTELTGTCREMKFKKMEELVEVLRHQLALASDDGASKESQIKQLSDDVKEAGVRIQEKEAELIQHYSEVLSDLRVTLAKQEEIIENQRMEIELLKCHVKEKTFQLNTQEKHGQGAAEEMTAIKSRLKHRDSIQPMIQDSENVSRVGQKCLGEKHGETIQSQQQAISQLRQRLSDAESAHLPVGSHQATLKELSRVRRELLKLKSEKRAASILTCTKDTSRDNKHSLKKDVELLRDHKAQEKALQETLDFSERTYKQLAETVYKALPDLKWPDIGVLSAQAEHSIRKKMLTDRTKFANSVTTSLRVITTKKQEREANPGEVEEALENIAQLEAQLSSVSEELEQQKRLNKALLKRKDFKEAQHAEAVRRPQHSCIATYQ